MAKIEGLDNLTHPAAQVFEALRDKTPDLVEFLPNIEHVEVLSREENPPVVHLYNKWQGSQEDVPAIVRPFIKKELLCWYDRAGWDEKQLKCDWEIESVIGRKFFSCRGATTIKPASENSCVFSLEGELCVDPNHLPGVPKFLARKLQQPLERFIVKAISPNLTSIAQAVQKYLERQKA